MPVTVRVHVPKYHILWLQSSPYKGTLESRSTHMDTWTLRVSRVQDSRLRGLGSSGDQDCTFALRWFRVGGLGFRVLVGTSFPKRSH